MLARLKKLKIRSDVKVLGHVQHSKEHLLLALSWFKNSIQEKGGSAAKYSLLTKNYSSSYPETTGYWINTLFLCRQKFQQEFASVFGDRKIEKELSEWLISVQRLDGTFPGLYGDFLNQSPRVFNTGQIVLGLLDEYEHSKNLNTLDSIMRVCDWLVKVQSPDGCWRQFTSCQFSSNTRTAYALIRLGKIVNDQKFIETGARNIEYAISCQNESGYYENNGFDQEEDAFTHTIAYAIDGILHAGIIMNNEKWIASARKAFNSLIPLIRQDGFLSGRINNAHNGTVAYCCLTGNCQMSIIGFLLNEKTKDVHYRNVAIKLLNFVKEHQVKSKDARTNGGLTGSWPINGGYNPYEMPNWVGKFFVDALLLEEFPMDKLNG